MLSAAVDQPEPVPINKHPLKMTATPISPEIGTEINDATPKPDISPVDVDIKSLFGWVLYGDMPSLNAHIVASKSQLPSQEYYVYLHKLLVQTHDPDFGGSLLHWACINQKASLVIVDYLVQLAREYDRHTGSIRNTTANTSSAMRKLSSGKKLVDLVLNDANNKAQATPLHWTLRYHAAHGAFHEAGQTPALAEANRIQIAQYLIKCGAQISLKDVGGFDILAMGVQTGDWLMVLMLLTMTAGEESEWESNGSRLMQLDRQTAMAWLSYTGGSRTSKQEMEVTADPIESGYFTTSDGKHMLRVLIYFGTQVTLDNLKMMAHMKHYALLEDSMRLGACDGLSFEEKEMLKDILNGAAVPAQVLDLLEKTIAEQQSSQNALLAKTGVFLQDESPSGLNRMMKMDAYAKKMYVVPYAALTVITIALFVFEWQVALAITIVSLIAANMTIFKLGNESNSESPTLISIVHSSLAVVLALTFALIPTAIWNGYALWHLFSLGFEIATIYALYKTTVLDPGSVPSAALASQSNTEFAKVIRDLRKLVNEGMLSQRSVCSTCIIPRPRRSKHCSECDRCVHRFDHHCPWIYACVAQGNHQWFMAFLTLMTVGCAVVAAELGMLRLTLSGLQLGLVFWICYLTAVGAWALVLLAIQIGYISKGVTLNEYVNSYKYDYVKDKNEEDVSVGSTLQNWRSFLALGSRGGAATEHVYDEIKMV